MAVQSVLNVIKDRADAAITAGTPAAIWTPAGRGSRRRATR